MGRTNQLRTIIYPIGPSIAYIPLTQGFFALIDADYIGFASGVNWQAEPSDQDTIYVRNRKGYLHRLLLGSPPTQVDHRNGNPLDNRMCNLRKATVSQNQLNMRRPRHNKSGYKGVVYVSHCFKKWEARIQVNRKQIVIGRYATIAEAQEAYKMKALELAGEFAKFD